MSAGPYREAVIDTAAISANVRRLREIVTTGAAGDASDARGGAAAAPLVLAVVKANGYGHGAVAVAQAALAGGADWLGTADLREAIVLRQAGISAPLLCWLHDPDETFDQALEHGIDVGVSSIDQLEAVARAAEQRGGRARLQFKLDTGLSRNGLHETDWEAAFARASELEARGSVLVTGIFSHVSNSSRDDDLAAVAVFERGVAKAREAGLDTELLHLAATAAAIRVPETRFSMVRFGLGIYGLSPFDDETSADLGLTPAMTLRGRVANVRRVPAGAGVSYDYTYRTAGESTLALVPLGYAEGIPRSASGRAEVVINGRRHRIAGRVAMDQFVVDVGDDPVSIGDEVVLWGDPAGGAPSVEEWALSCGTINYEMVTRLGARVVRSYTGV